MIETFLNCCDIGSKMHAKLSEMCLGLRNEVRWTRESAESLKFLFEGC